MNRKQVTFAIPWPNLSQFWAFARKWLLPNPGTLVLMVILALAIPALAAPRYAPEATSTSTISYQGRLADSAGNPLTGYYNLEFRIYDVPDGGVPLWEELWTGANSVAVSDGLFNVMLGSINNTLASAIEGHDELYLGITVGTDSEMVPRVQLGSVPFAMYAAQANVADGSITTAKIADGAVTSVKLNVNEGLDVNGKLRVGWLGAPQWGQLGYCDDAWACLFNMDQGDGKAALRVGTNHGTALTVDPNRNVGIGTTSPGAKLHVVGDFLVTGGAKSAVVQAGTYGQRRLYAAESPEVRFFDEGLGKLKDGSMRVDLDPIFLATIEGQFLVHVTPYGNASLYVAEIGDDFFVVKAREGDPTVTFSWRLSAFRQGFQDVRLEKLHEEDPASENRFKHR